MAHRARSHMALALGVLLGLGTLSVPASAVGAPPPADPPAITATDPLSGAEGDGELTGPVVSPEPEGPGELAGPEKPREAEGPSAGEEPGEAEVAAAGAEPGEGAEPEEPAEPAAAGAEPGEGAEPEEPAEPAAPEEEGEAEAPEGELELTEPDAPAPAVIAYRSNSSEYFVVNEDGSASKLTDEQWLELGSPAPEQVELRFLKSPWSQDIFRAAPTGSEHVDAAAWFRAGQPTPASALVDLATLSWSPSVYGTISFRFDRTVPATASHHLTPAQWEALTADQRRSLRTVPAVPGSSYYTWSTNASELFVTPPDGSNHHLTFAQWTAAGRPAATRRPGGYVTAPWSRTVWKVSTLDQSSAGPRVTPAAWDAADNPTPLTQVRVPGTSVYRWSTNSSQIFAELPDGVTHRYTLAEWQRAGSPSPSTRAGGFYSVPWSSTVWYYPRPGSTSGASALSYTTYRTFGEPAPTRTTSLPGGTYAKYWGDDQVRFTALGVTSVVPFWGYVEAGYPTPRTEYARVFVYGTLRPGQSAWSLVSPSVEATAVGLVPGKSLYAAPSGRFPYMVPGGSGVAGTLLRLRSSTYASTIARLDAYENHNPSKPAASQPYNRIFVTTSSGERVMTYQAGPTKAVEVRATGRYIPSGDWLRR